jgi:hypothetical protein
MNEAELERLIWYDETPVKSLSLEQLTDYQNLLQKCVDDLDVPKWRRVVDLKMSRRALQEKL